MTAGVFAFAMAPSAAGQTLDWSAAGGDLFAPMALEAGEIDDAPLHRAPGLSQPMQAAVRQAAQAHGLDEKLLHALILVESGYDPLAVSPAGAAGLTQLMPATAQELGVADRFDPVANLNGGADYLARQISRFRDLRLALAAYNAGPSRVARLGRVPDIAETRDYVATVIECFLALSAGQGPRNSRQCRSRGAP